MATFTRARTSRQRYHSASRSTSHQQDKQRGEIRQKKAFVLVKAPARPSPVRDFSPYLTGHEFRRTADGWERCQGAEEYGAYLDAEAERRSWFIDQTTRHGKPCRMRRRVGTPVELVTVTFPPWLSAWAHDQLRTGDVRATKAKLAQIRNRTAANACGMFERNRFVLGVAVHVDTSDIHLDYALSRQDGRGGRLGDGAALALVGPWAVGCERQVRAGATISATKRKRLARSILGFRRRHGEDAVPLDVRLARDLDAVALDVVGPELVPYIRGYAAQVPQLERAHQRAALEALAAARAKIAPDPDIDDPEPDFPEEPQQPREIPPPPVPGPTL